MAFQERATEEQIARFENENGITFPPEYREWLHFSDGGECFVPTGVQFYGVKHKPLINVDEEDRPDEQYIVIGALPNGDPILCKKDGDHRISIYNHEAGTIENDEIFQSFFVFLINLKKILGIGE